MKNKFSLHHALIALRAGVGVMMMAHGFQRLYYNTVSDFGSYLDSQGFVIGIVLAWSITVFELVGGLTMIAGFFTRWLCIGWSVVLVMGVIMVHARNGWFVVGPGTGGVEYSVLLLLALLVLGTWNSKRP